MSSSAMYMSCAQSIVPESFFIFLPNILKNLSNKSPPWFMSVIIPITSLYVALELTIPSSKKNWYIAWSWSAFKYLGFLVSLYIVWGCKALKASLIALPNTAGSVKSNDALPVAIVVTAPDVKFLPWVKGPNTVLPNWVIPLGIKNIYLYAKLLVIPSNGILSPNFKASAMTLLVNIPSSGLV